VNGLVEAFLAITGLNAVQASRKTLTVTASKNEQLRKLIQHGTIKSSKTKMTINSRCKTLEKRNN
jgi:ribosomal protein L19E